MTDVIFQVWDDTLINSSFLIELLSNKTVKLSSSVRKICAAEYGCQYNTQVHWLGSHTHSDKQE